MQAAITSSGEFSRDASCVPARLPQTMFFVKVGSTWLLDSSRFYQEGQATF